MVFRLGGIKRENPIASVISPGVSRRAPPISIKNPSKILPAGTDPDLTSLWNLIQALIPSRLASIPPTIPVIKIKSKVSRLPMMLAISKRITSSINGTAIKGMTHFHKFGI